jgi:hypothetical protein
MKPERSEQKSSPGVNVELIGRKAVKLIYPGGYEEIIRVPEKAPQRMTGAELAALTVMKLVIPEEFSQETSGVDQDGFRAERESDIRDLPGGRESDHEAALTWSGSVLQTKGWSSREVAEILFYDLPSNPAVGEHLGTTSKRAIEFDKERLRSAVAGRYPGAAASIKRRKDKNVPDW